jgi:hypothetical protein
LVTAAIDLLLQIDERTTRGVEARIARPHAAHAHGGIVMAMRTGYAGRTVWLAPELTAAFNPQEPGIGEVVVLQALVLLRQIGVP